MLTLRLTRRRLAGCALLALAVLAGGVWWLPSSGRVTRANFEKVPHRATYEEVVELLGKPDFDESFVPKNDEPFRQCHWNRPHAWADFMFNSSGRVIGRGFEEQGFHGYWRGWWINKFQREPPFQWPWR
jgi:hypothetical protein